jgi:hypothetical protein
MTKSDESGTAAASIATTAAKTLSVPEAGRLYFNLGKNGSYDAARKGLLPVIKIGSRKRVPIVALERMMTEAKPKAE